MTTARRVLICALTTIVCATMTPVPSARAVDLAVGMALNIGDHLCTLGFFGFNRRGDRLAVTAGHCSDTVNQSVYANNGVEIGAVVSRKPDEVDSDGKLTGKRGYTIFAVYERFSLEPFFRSASRSIATGVYVTKFGERTGKTRGRITAIAGHEDDPELAVMYSDMVQLSGDSGCPWVIDGPALVGMGSSGDQETEGGGAGSQAQPIGAVLDMIHADASVWGEDFLVWVD